MTPSDRAGEGNRRATAPWEDPRWITRVQALADDTGAGAAHADAPGSRFAGEPNHHAVGVTPEGARSTGEGSGAGVPSGAAAPAAMRLLEATAQAAMMAAGLEPRERDELLALARIHPDETGQRHAYAWIIALLDGQTLPTR